MIQKEENRIRRGFNWKERSGDHRSSDRTSCAIFPAFSYNPEDARFLGAPADFIVFDGLAEGDLKRIVSPDVKSGKFSQLLARERQVKECIIAGRVTCDVIFHSREDRDRNAHD